MAALEWSAAALKEFAETLSWLAEHRNPDVAEAARAAVEQAAHAAAASPLAYPWVGAIFAVLAETDRSYRRVLAWQSRLQVFYRYNRQEDRVVVLHVRGSRQRPLDPHDLEQNTSPG